jgi:hypothetical protein
MKVECCCDPSTRLQLLAAGVPEVAICALECHNEKMATAGMGTFNWAGLLALVMKYGPQLLAFLLSFLNPTPVPPAPPTP